MYRITTFVNFIANFFDSVLLHNDHNLNFCLFMTRGLNGIQQLVDDILHNDSVSPLSFIGWFSGFFLILLNLEVWGTLSSLRTLGQIISLSK